MPLLVASAENAPIVGKNIFFDNDVLLNISTDEELLKEIFQLLNGSYFMIDPLTELEFMRGVIYSDEITIKDQFIKTAFEIAVNHQEQFRKIQENHILLSRIYRTNKQQGKNASFVDLSLAGRIMMNYSNSLLLTCNKVDFPPCVFDIARVFVYEKPSSGEIVNYYLLAFNHVKFQKNFDSLTEKVLPKKEKKS